MGQKIKARQQKQPHKARNLIVKDMILRGEPSKMRHRSDRRPNDARNRDWTRDLDPE